MGSREQEPLVWLLDIVGGVIVCCAFAVLLGRWVLSWFLP